MPPHVTVLGSASHSEISGSAFLLPLLAVADSAVPTRCITVTAHPVAELLALRAAALARPDADPSPYEPHLSLVYGELAAAERAALRDSVALTLPTSVAIVALALVDTTDGDHTRWRELWRLPLAPPG